MSIELRSHEALYIDDTRVFHFTELMCPRTQRVVLADGFDAALLRLRATYGEPLRVASCCRSHGHNVAIQGHRRSLHVYDNSYWLGSDGGCAAIDFTIETGESRHTLLTIAYQQGWSVGHASHFVHLDRRDYATLPPCSFHYTR